jgi:hypothetical protein
LLRKPGAGAAPSDSTERALQKRLTVSVPVGLLPLTFLWSLVYFVAGAPTSAAIPRLYTIVAPINTAVFAWTRNLALYRFRSVPKCCCSTSCQRICEPRGKIKSRGPTNWRFGTY